VSQQDVSFCFLSACSRSIWFGPTACGSVTGTAPASGSGSVGGMMVVAFLLVSLSLEARINREFLRMKNEAPIYFVFTRVIRV
jgi:hypothetical protein